LVYRVYTMRFIREGIMSSLPKSKQLRIYISDGLLSSVERNSHIFTQSRTKFIATAITRFLRHSPKVTSIDDYPEHHDYVRFELLDRQRQIYLRMPPMLIERIDPMQVRSMLS
jgi:hypothetical protein